MGFPRPSSNLEKLSLFFMNMSQIGHLQGLLEDIFDEFTPQFVNKMHWLQLQYRVEKNRRILVLVRIFRKNADKAVMKSAMYVLEISDLDFLRAYLAGLVLTLAVWYVKHSSDKFSWTSTCDKLTDMRSLRTIIYLFVVGICTFMHMYCIFRG